MHILIESVLLGSVYRTFEGEQNGDHHHGKEESEGSPHHGFAAAEAVGEEGWIEGAFMD